MRYAYVPESDAAHEAQLAALRADLPTPVLAPPLVPVRAPRAPAEFADKRQAGTLGKLAIGLGWRVRPLYWQAATGVETCCLQLACGSAVRAVATWERSPGEGGWASGVAYAWIDGVPDTMRKVGTRTLTQMIKQLGEAA